ncbi:MAG: hypothetical protein HY350_03560 [Candidatus Omnitrophica bacterium]|nr:hypothetical protein [Candidatus Omnitrophota bacterium]
MEDLFQVILYVIIGLIWLISVVTTKSRKRKTPDETAPAGGTKTGEEEFRKFLRTIGLEPEPAPAPFPEQTPEPEVIVEETEQVQEELPQPEEEFEEPTRIIPIPRVQFHPQPVVMKPPVEQPVEIPAIQPVLSPYLSHLSSDTLKQGIILSTLLGPPRSVQLLKGLARGNLRWRIQ